jgi:hypothetical protein
MFYVSFVDKSGFFKIHHLNQLFGDAKMSHNQNSEKCVFFFFFFLLFLFVLILMFDPAVKMLVSCRGSLWALHI